ncbi:tetratricopeptide repeat protein [Candidatus Thioglobus sp.]|uniref:tetratricopeptide repeat protein n=1 Tax=Candidatus Thioglobus sp. TaxID=2026721 RepID=UPI003D152BA2
MKSKQFFLGALVALSIGSSPSVFSMPQNSSKVLQQVSDIMANKTFEDTEKKLQKIIQQSPNKKAYTHLANLYMGNNKNKEAISNYQQAALLDPTDAKLFTSMSIAYLHLGFYSMSKAMAEQALTLEPTLGHANKIIKYIDKKQEVLEKANKSRGEQSTL